MGNQIHWFPGHMKKALDEIKDKIKIVDVIIELFDSRCPFSSINNELEQISSNKKKLIILTKPDLADPLKTNALKQKLTEKYDVILVLNINDQQSKKAIEDAVRKLGQDKHKRDIAKGMKPQPIRAMILGIPNVGKSSLINRFAAKKVAGVQNKPGYTRGEQWIKINNDFLLLDTPGVLPMNYDNKKKATNLALVGSIREEILPTNELSDYLLSFLKENYPNSLKDRFDIDEINDFNDVYLSICKRRGLLDNNGLPNIEKAQLLLLKEFKDGKLGRISLEK